jgi:hypothetical protein
MRMMMLAKQSAALLKAANKLLVGEKAPFLVVENGKLFAQAKRMRVRFEGKAAAVEFYDGKTLLISYDITMGTEEPRALELESDGLAWFARFEIVA